MLKNEKNSGRRARQTAKGGTAGKSASGVLEERIDRLQGRVGQQAEPEVMIEVFQGVCGQIDRNVHKDQKRERPPLLSKLSALRAQRSRNSAHSCTATHPQEGHQLRD